MAGRTRRGKAAAKRAIVIGAGIGGSALTLLLADAGIPATLLEKNRYIGGSCAGYVKQGFQVDFGTHMFTRGPRGPLGEVLRRVGEPRAIEFLRTRNIAELRLPAAPGSARILSIPVPSQLHRSLPALLAFAATMEMKPIDLVEAGVLFTALLTMSDAEAESWDHRTVEQLIARYTKNPRVAGALSFLLGLYFVIPPWEVSAGEAVYCFKRMMLDNWLSYPAGGAKAIPTTYCRLAKGRGAEVHTRAPVRRILIEGGRVRGVELAGGKRLDADLVVSTSSVRTTVLHLCDTAALPLNYVEAARGIKGSQIAIQAKIALDAKLVDAGCLMGGFSDKTSLFQGDAETLRRVYGQIESGHVPDVIPFYCPVPTNFDPSLAPPGHQLLTVCAAAPTTDIELADPKAAWEEALMATMRAIVPGLDDHVVFVDRTTVAWMERWLGKEYGPAISTAQTPWQVGDLRPSVATGVPGLYVAGDGAGGRGVGTELAADSAMECAERILDDLGLPMPAAWFTPRHKPPGLARTLKLLVRPTRTVAGAG